jgi:hypothetical protein
MGNVLCNDIKRLDDVCDPVGSEKKECEHIQTIKFLTEEVEMFKCKNIYYEERICKLQAMLDDTKRLQSKQIDEIKRVNEVVLLKQRGNINLISQIQRLEKIKKFFYDIVNTDDCIIVNNVVQNTPSLDCDWFQGSIFDKSEYIQLVVVYFKNHFKEIIEHKGFKI